MNLYGFVGRGRKIRGRGRDPVHNLLSTDQIQLEESISESEWIIGYGAPKALAFHTQLTQDHDTKFEVTSIFYNMSSNTQIKSFDNFYTYFSFIIIIIIPNKKKKVKKEKRWDKAHQKEQKQ